MPFPTEVSEATVVNRGKNKNSLGTLIDLHGSPEMSASHLNTPLPSQIVRFELQLFFLLGLLKMVTECSLT